MSNLYDSKDKSYYSHIRNDIISLVPGSGLKVLEIGCGKGLTLIELKKSGRASEIVGIEINQASIEENRQLLDNVIIGDIEIIDIDYPDNYFDIIILADVLEHLNDPWGLLKRVKKYLSCNGFVVASIPNIREFETMKSIFLKGDFRYTEAGILDKTHMRFFCKKNIFEMLNREFEIIKANTFPELKIGKKALLNRLTFRKFEEFFVVQYICLAKYKKDG